MRKCCLKFTFFAGQCLDWRNAAFIQTFPSNIAPQYDQKQQISLGIIISYHYTVKTPKKLSYFDSFTLFPVENSAA